MTIEVLKSKVKHIKVTTSHINNNGIIRVTSNLMDSLNLSKYEKVSIFNEKKNSQFEVFVVPFKDVEENGDEYQITTPVYIGGAGDKLTITSTVTINIDDASNHEVIVIDIDKINDDTNL